MIDESQMKALLEAFMAETEEGLVLAEEALLVLERTPEDREALGSVFRVVHTIKGNAGIFDFKAIGEIAHAMEDLLDEIREGGQSVTNRVVSNLLQGLDRLRGRLADPALRESGIDDGDEVLIRKLRSSGSDDTSTSSASSSSSVSRHARTIRIDLSRLDRLLDLSGEIGIARGRVTQMLEDPDVGKQAALEAQRDADLLHLEMQELVMRLRMVPVGPSFGQLMRVVRDAAQSAGKKVDFRLEGEDVEVDLTVIEHLKDPLMHMIRNSIDHGIEIPEKRVAAGKNETGRLVLRSYHDAGSIVIELTDDGAGINHSRVLGRAKERGLIGQREELNEEEVFELLFHPGFSTAASVTDLSGRGVGLDVVRRNIDDIHGTVAIESEEGRGTTFRIRLPLTLAIVDGLSVGVCGESFIIPMEAVVEAFHLGVGEDATSTTGVLNYRDESIPYLRLRNRLFAERADTPIRENVVVVRYGRGRAGLVVDELLGECHSVVKPLAKALRSLRGLSGSAILPSGKVSFILDVNGLLQGEIDRRGHTDGAGIFNHPATSTSIPALPI